jgi:hypothetical protein
VPILDVLQAFVMAQCTERCGFSSAQIFKNVCRTDCSGKEAASNHTFFLRSFSLSKFNRTPAGHCFPPPLSVFFSEVVKFVTYWTAVAVQREETIRRLSMSEQALCPTCYAMRPRNNGAPEAHLFLPVVLHCSPYCLMSTNGKRSFSSEGCRVVITNKIPLNRTARHLEGNTGSTLQKGGLIVRGK